ncbi:MAG: FAD-dependent monooxygenase [Actinomycetota bacterium]|nr:FAD-dependent monooxygenase [Actinomycetota bacterium]
MQFHLNGFRPGDPTIASAEAALPPRAPDRPLPAEVDVLIVGAGPTGLTLAAQLARIGGVTVCVAEQKDGPLLVGQADGIACRTMEMFGAFGFADDIAREAYHVNETVFWKPDPDAPGRIRRSGRIQDVEDGLSEHPHVILNQARVHDRFLQVMQRSASTLAPDYGRRLVDLRLPVGDEPAVARFERVGDESAAGATETVRARYVVGCDGARSAVRGFMGRTLAGDAANQSWGVMDVLAVTDFPDIRFKAVVHSASAGNLLVIPREGGYLFRLYIELDELDADERVANRNITVDRLIDAARHILSPYTLDVKEVAWWSVYEIGQRLCDRYDDLEADDDVREPRVFIAGDACHTHSPKAGQGMNVSMRDGFNLGWKLAAVLRGRARPDVLRTYSAERHAVAKRLIDFDREFAAMFSANPRTEDDPDGVDPAEFQRYFQQHGRFTAGTETRYAPSLLVGDGTFQHLAKGFEIGTRFHSAPVRRVADALAMHLGHVVEADGRWRLFVFADEAAPDAPGSALATLCERLTTDARSPLVRSTRDGEDIDAVVDVRAIVQQRHDEVTIPEMPPLLRPAKGRYGLLDHEKVFCPDPRTGGDVFDLRGIDRTTGAMVVVRPDQHVAHVLPLDGFDALADFFAGFLLPVR